MTKNKADSAFYEKKADRTSYLYFDKVICNSRSATTPHFHDSIEIVLAVKGQCEIYINGTKIILNEGDGAFIDRFDVRYYNYLPDSEYYVFLISKKYLDENNGFDKKRLPAFLPECENYAKLKALFDSTYAIWEDSNDIFRIGLVNVILGALVQNYSLTQREFKGEVKTLADTLLYINENFAEDITLEFLSNKFCYSKNYFSALFNRFAGMNLREYINQRRICEFERIKSQNPEIPTYAAAQLSGFKSLKTFYRAYNKYNDEKS